MKDLEETGRINNKRLLNRRIINLGPELPALVRTKYVPTTNNFGLASMSTQSPRVILRAPEFAGLGACATDLSYWTDHSLLTSPPSCHQVHRGSRLHYILLASFNCLKNATKAKLSLDLRKNCYAKRTTQVRRSRLGGRFRSAKISWTF